MGHSQLDTGPSMWPACGLTAGHTAAPSAGTSSSTNSSSGSNSSYRRRSWRRTPRALLRRVLPIGACALPGSSIVGSSSSSACFASMTASQPVSQAPAVSTRGSWEPAPQAAPGATQRRSGPAGSWTIPGIRSSMHDLAPLGGLALRTGRAALLVFELIFLVTPMVMWASSLPQAAVSINWEECQPHWPRPLRWSAAALVVTAVAKATLAFYAAMAHCPLPAAPLLVGSAVSAFRSTSAFLLELNRCMGGGAHLQAAFTRGDATQLPPMNRQGWIWPAMAGLLGLKRLRTGSWGGGSCSTNWRGGISSVIQSLRNCGMWVHHAVANWAPQPLSWRVPIIFLMGLSFSKTAAVEAAVAAAYLVAPTRPLKLAGDLLGLGVATLPLHARFWNKLSPGTA